METGTVFVATLSAILLILLIVSTLRWWRKRIGMLNQDLSHLNRSSNNDTNDDNWIFSIERGTDRQLIRYSTDEQQVNSTRRNNTNCRHYATSEKSGDTSSKIDDGLPSYDEAIKVQQQYDSKLANTNAALAGSVV